MDSWKWVWRCGMVPSLATEGLKRLLAALEADDRRIVQGSTTTPPPLMVAQDWTMNGCDPLVFAAIDEFEGTTVGEAEERFAKVCFECDQRLGEPAACRFWLNWIDDTPRPEAWAEMIAELKINIAEREATADIDPALAAALEANPNDHTLRLAISDYLRERGQDEKADTMAATTEGQR